MRWALAARRPRYAVAIVAAGQALFWGSYLALAWSARAMPSWNAALSAELPRLTITLAVAAGMALMLLLPISRFSRLQVLTGLFLVALGVDAWMTEFGADDLRTHWFPVLRYTIEYAMLLSAAMFLNALGGWRDRDLRAGMACCMGAIAATVVTNADADAIKVLDSVAVALLLYYVGLVFRRLWPTAPGPAARGLAILLIGLASAAFDIVARPPFPGNLRASLFSPLFLVCGLLLELALQGHRLNQEAENARSNLERQVLEQDASLLRSSHLLRHHERTIAATVERQRLLREIHDGAGGMLAHLLAEVRTGHLGSDAIARELQEVVDDLANIAAVIDGGEGPVDQAIAILTERMVPRLARAGIVLDKRCTLPCPAPTIAAERLLDLYRLLQEGFANTLRHADATHVILTVAMPEVDTLHIAFSDDGRGFDPGAVPSGAHGGGRGLANMRRRAARMGASLKLASAPGAGTQLTLAMPLRRRD